MTTTVVNLNNTNFMTKAQYDGVTPVNTQIYNIDIDTDSAFKGKINSWIEPDWANGVSITTSGWIAPKNGWVYFRSGASGTSKYLYVNGEEVLYGGTAIKYCQFFPVAKDDVVTWSGTTADSCSFYPCKGEV